MGKAIGSLLGVQQPAKQPIIEAPKAPPTIDAARERQTTADRLKYRRGGAATRRFTGLGGAGRVGIYRALGGSGT